MLNIRWSSMDKMRRIYCVLLSFTLFIASTGATDVNILPQYADPFAATTEVPFEDYRCVWYTQCDTSFPTHNCEYKGPPKEMTEQEGIDIMKDRCPHFFDNDGKLFTCCDLNQIKTMSENINKAAGLLMRCPSCYRNMLQNICAFTCHPNQAPFLRGVEFEDVPTGRMITEVDIYLTERYMNETYDSCSNVIMPSSGQLAIELACGEWGSDCTPQRFFDYMGDVATNPFVPFQMNYIMVSSNESYEDITPLDPKTAKCSEAFDENSWPCSCVDCPSACPAGLEVPPPEPPCTVGELDCGVFSAIMVFIFGMGIIFGVWGAKKYLSKQRRRAESAVTDASSVSERGGLRGTLNKLQKIGDKMTVKLENCFFHIGVVCSEYPARVLCIGAVIVTLLLHGIIYLQVTVDPVELWAAPKSLSRLEKDYFDSKFRPFYRTEQIFFKAVNLPNVVHVTEDETVTFGPAFNKEFLETIYRLQEDIQNLGEDIPGATMLKDVCNAPLRNDFTGPKIVEQCLVQSTFGYYNNSWEEFLIDEQTNEGYTINYLDQMLTCIRNPYNVLCFAPYGGPILPSVALGGYLPDGELSGTSDDMILAEAIVLTFLVDNYLEKDDKAPALEWEKRYLDFMKKWVEEEKPDYMDVAYYAERSIEDELTRSSKTEATTVLISYLVMFLYIAVALGHIRSLATFFIDTKVTLAVGGIIVVIVSVGCSVGIFGYAGVPTTLLTIEVIPFLVLAVGVDNIFILVQRVQREPIPQPRNDYDQTTLIVARALGHVGPSMLLTAISEVTCFFLGAISEMPAVRQFSLFAGVALTIDFLMQITCFVSLLALDTRRQHAYRPDVLCCLKPTKAVVDRSKSVMEKQDKGMLYNFFSKFYTPFLLHKYVRFGVVIVFLAGFCVSLGVTPSLSVGLDQKLSMPEDSYVLKYFQFMEKLLSVGPPVYFVVKNGPDYSKSDVQDVICGGQRCRPDSLFTQLYAATKSPDYTYLVGAPSSWIDDFFDWTSVVGCCKYFAINGSFCPHSYTTSQGCTDCPITMREDGVRPIPDDFKKYVPFFLQDNPDANCAKGGRAAYAQGVNFLVNESMYSTVEDTYFMGYHTVLRTSEDYYEALRSARGVAAEYMNDMKKLGPEFDSIEVFPYSIVYVYYEQYLTMWEETFLSLGVSLLAIYVVTIILMGFDFVSATLVLGTIFSITVNMMGIMYWWHIELNAVSLVNLVMCVGISVEFCSHIVHSFSLIELSDPVARASQALTDMGSSIFSGITLTKFAGIIVLAFAKTQIFKVFYFRMYLSIVILGASHGLILLPVLLTYVGPLIRRRNLTSGRKASFSSNLNLVL